MLPTQEELIRLYLEKGVPLHKIAECFHVGHRKIRALTVEYGIPVSFSRTYKRRNRNNFVHIPLNNDSGYMLGVIYGDGSTCKTKGSFSSRLAVKDKDFALEFQRRLIKLGFQPNFYSYKNGDGEEFIVHQTSHSLYNFLKHSDLKTLNDAPDSVKANFLCGLFDSEGSVVFSNSENLKKATRTISIGMKDKHILEIARHLLNDLNIRTGGMRIIFGSSFNPSGVYYYFNISGEENLKTFYHKVNFSIERKRRILERIVSSYRLFKWTESKIAFLIENWKQMSDRELAENLQTSILSIRGRRRMLKLFRRVYYPRRRWTDAELETIMQYYPKIGSKIKHFLPNRTIHAIRAKAESLDSCRNDCKTTFELKSLGEEVKI